MNKNNKIIVTAIIIVVIVGIIYVFYAKPQTTQAPSTSTNDNIPNQSVLINKPTVGIPMLATVTYDGDNFSPASITIKQGGTVSFVDKSVSPMWIASNPHPVHTGYDGTNRETHCATGYVGSKPFDECSSGTSFSFMFSEIGSWGYHNHLNSGVTGTVVVIQ